MHLAGDSAYSAYVAGKSFAEITLGRVSDGHPPLYYWLLRLANRFFGIDEYAVRLPSALIGTLIVPLAWVAGRRIGGRRAGALAAALVALSPMLVFYAREPRMYSLLPLTALASLVFLDRALARGGWAWLGYVAATTIGLWSHYYVVPLVIGQTAFLAVGALPQLTDRIPIWLRPEATAQRCRVALGALALASLAFTPWLLFALARQSTATAGVISNATPPIGPLGFLETFLTPFHAGTGVDWRIGAVLGLTALVGWVLFVRRTWPDRGTTPSLARLASVSSGFVILLSGALFAVAPYAVRPRFMIVLLPAFLALAASALIRALVGRRLFVALFVLAVVHVGTLYAGHRIGRLTQENDALSIASRLEFAAQDGDLFASQASWYTGYLRAHPVAPDIVTRAFEEFSGPEAASDGRDRVWLSVYRENRHVVPWEIWFDDRWARIEQHQFDESRLVLFAPSPSATSIRPIQFVGRDGTVRAPTIVGLGRSPGQVAPGDAIATRIVWQARGPVDRVTPFLHLLDERGERRLGADDEPRNGHFPTTAFPAGESIDDPRGLLIPDDFPPGRYTLVLGMYPSGGGPRLAPDRQIADDTPSFGDLLTLGQIEIRARGVSRVAHAINTALAPGVTLTGWTGELDTFSSLDRGIVRWTSVDTWPLATRRDWLRRGAETWVAARLRFDSATTAPLALRVRLDGTAPAVRQVSIPPTDGPSERLVRVYLPVPRDGPADLIVEGPSGSARLARYRIDG